MRFVCLVLGCVFVLYRPRVCLHGCLFAWLCVLLVLFRFCFVSCCLVFLVGDCFWFGLSVRLSVLFGWLFARAFVFFRVCSVLFVVCLVVLSVGVC